MRRTFSLRLRLMIFYLLIFLVLATIMVTAMPFYYQQSLANETRTLTEGTLTSITRNIETYLDDLNRLTIIPYLNEEVMYALNVKASSDYDEMDDYTRLIADRALRRTFPVSMQNSRRDISATVLIAGDGSMFITHVGGMLPERIPDYSFATQDWYQKTIQADGKAVFISSHPQDYLGNGSEQKEVFSVARLIKDPNTRRPLGVIMADADTVVLEHIVGDINFNVSSIVCVFDNENKLLYASGPISLELQQAAIHNETPVTAGGDSYVTVSRIIPSSNWRVIVLLSEAEITAQSRWAHLSALLFAVAGLALTGVLFYALSHWITRPFEEMIAVMREVQTGKLDTRFVVTGNDEISELGNALNHMIEQLNHLIDREYRAVLNQREAEYHALQSQIQPHFLYNTLNGLVGLSRLNDRVGLEKAILALSGMLHYTLEGDDWVRLEEEITFIQKYCNLQQLRFPDRLRVEISCEETIREIRVPKLILQPLVENSVIHGVEPISRPCTVSISAVLRSDNEQQRVVITVADDGAGFDAEADGHGGRLGIANVRERLNAVFPGYTFAVASQVNSGTQTVIEIPFTAVSDLPIA
jgi:two-component system, sensor histidine kinase YesM